MTPSIDNESDAPVMTDTSVTDDIADQESIPEAHSEADVAASDSPVGDPEEPLTEVNFDEQFYPARLPARAGHR